MEDRTDTKNIWKIRPSLVGCLIGTAALWAFVTCSQENKKVNYIQENPPAYTQNLEDNLK